MTKKYPLLMTPVSKEIIWGGDRLKKEYGKTAPFDKIAESWELTVREGEMCVIANGELAGVKMSDYISSDPDGILGKSCAKYDRFPLLIKFIDAADRLSIQVHPDNEYSLANEGELGKTEMWYIMAAEEGAKLVYGLKEGCTIEEFRDAVHAGRTEEMLNFVPVHAGEVYFIPSGQVHAIGAGILIAEIQQNSNITYRVYDYNRKGADGKPRQLHTEKALDVIKLRSEDEINAIRFSHPEKEEGGVNLASCEYFTVKKYSADGELVLSAGDDSFLSVLVLEADGCEIGGNPAKRGDSFFIPAGCGEVKVSGKAEIIVSKVN